MMCATSSNNGGKSYFWTGVACGATVAALGVTWWTSQSSRGSSKKKKKKRTTSFAESKSPQGRFGLLSHTSSPSTRDVCTNTSFLSNVMEELWPYIKIAGADMIRETVEPSFADLPGPMKTCRFTKLDLGDVPIRMDNIVVHPLQPDGSVQFDIDIEWDGECDFQLKANYIGTFGIQQLKLSGRMAIILKPLTNELPVVSGIQYGFINMPTIDISFSGLASVAELPVLESTVQEALKSSLSTSVLPYRMLYKMSVTNNFLDTYQPPLGVMRLTVQYGTGFVIERRLLAKDDIPDVYLNVTLGAIRGIWRTKTIKDNLDPEWNEQGDFCLFDREQILHIHAWDEDKGPLDPDDDLGTATVTVGEMLLSPHRTVTLPLSSYNKKKEEEKDTGASVTVSCALCEWTPDLTSMESKHTSPLHNEIVGLLVVIINRAFDLPLDRKLASTFVKVTYGGEEFDSNMIYDYPGWDSVNPIYDSGITIPITAGMPCSDEAEVRLDLINIAGEKSTILGSTTVNFASLKDLPNNTLTETRKMGTKGATLEYRVSLSGVLAATSDQATRSTMAPGTSSPTRPLPTSSIKAKGGSHRLDMDQQECVGIFRVTVVQARGLKIQEELFGFDVPDVFFEVFFEGEKFTTSVKHNNITPVWNETKDWKLLDHGQILMIKGWDRNEREEDPDILIGSGKTTVGKLLLAGGSMDMELKKEGRRSGVYVALRGDMVE